MKGEEWQELKKKEVDMDKIWEEVDDDRREMVGEMRRPGDIDTSQYAHRYKIAQDHARKLFKKWHDVGHDKWDAMKVWDEELKRSLWIIRLKQLP
jgi:hypothetical protein